MTLTGALNVRVLGGAGLYVTVRPFGIEPGELGTSLSVMLTIESNAFAGRIYRTTAGNCTINVSKNEVIQSLGIARQYQIEGVGALLRASDRSGRRTASAQRLRVQRLLRRDLVRRIEEARLTSR